MICPDAVDLIFVPAGAEARSVRQGLVAAAGSPQVIEIPIGAAARTAVLAQLQAGQIRGGQTGLLMGLGGGLSPQLEIGDGVLVKSCLVLEGDSLQERYATDSSLNSRLLQRAPDLRQGMGISCDRIIATAAEKQHLHHRYQADVVDMEAAVLLALLQPYHIPLAVLRVVSDPHDQNLPDLTPALQADGRLHQGRLLRQMVRQPLASSQLVRSALISLAALKRLTRTLFS